MSRLADLLSQLEEMGYAVERRDGAAFVGLEPGGSQVHVYEASSWMQVGIRVASKEEVQGTRFPEMRDRWMIAMHDRYLGCRFSFDAEGALALVADIYPTQQSGDGLAEVVNQVIFVAERLSPLVLDLLEHGREPDDEEVDGAFADASAH